MAEAHWDDRRFQDAIRRYPGRVYRAARSRILAFVRRFVRHDIARGRLSGNPLKVRTGRLRRSFQAEATGATLSTLRISAFSTSPYAGIHETGGTIRAKGKFLSIPLDAAMTPAGVTRAPIRAFPNTFLIPSGQNWLVMNRQGRGATPVFLLTRAVRIPARLGFADAWRRREGQLPSILAAVIDDALDEGAA